MTRYVSAAETARFIRSDLKRAFPATKFSVRTKDGRSIYIRWVDGPSAKAVDRIVGNYEGKGFDGMIDLAYSIEAWVLNGEIIGTRCSGTVGSMGTVAPWGMIPPHDDAELVSFGAGYIFTRREHSPAFVERLKQAVAAYWGLEVPATETHNDGTAYVKATAEQDREARDRTGYWWSDLIHQASQDRQRYAVQTRGAND